MGTTTRLELPYPDDIDEADGPEAVQNLAEALDNAAMDLPNAGSLPGTGVRGQWIKVGSNLYRHNGTAWEQITGTSTGTGSLEDESVTGPKLSDDQRWETGDLKDTLRTSAPTGWLLCDGSAVSRSTYADLFALIGTAHGAGNGTTTFNLPDYRGRMRVGKGTHADVDSLGESDALAVGSRTPKHRHVSDSAGSHNHGGADGAAGSHAHTYVITGEDWSIGAAGGGLRASGKVTQYPGAVTSTVGNHQHSISSDGAHTHQVGPAGTNLDTPPYGVCNVMVKT